MRAYLSAPLGREIIVAESSTIPYEDVSHIAD